MAIRAKMRVIRRAKDLTLADIAKEVGVTTGYISMIERGTRGLSYNMAKKIATIFELKPDDIFYDDEIDEENL